jgi:hypothetical protein
MIRRMKDQEAEKKQKGKVEEGNTDAIRYTFQDLLGNSIGNIDHSA